MAEKKQTVGKKITTNTHYSNGDDEIDLTSILQILWRRKLLILIVFALVLATAGLFIYTSTPKYRIMAQIAPGITGYDHEGNPQRDISKGDIQTWFREKSYLTVPLTTTHKSDNFPEFSTVADNDSKVLTIEFNWPQPEKGVAILEIIIRHLRKNNPTLGVESVIVSRSVIEEKKKIVEQNINRIVFEESRLEGGIELQQNKTKSVKAELDSIESNIKQTHKLAKRMRDKITAINKNTEQLMGLREKMTDGNSDKLALLMYSNIIQQNIQYVMNLEQRIADLEKQLNELSVEKSRKKEELEQIQINIKELVTTKDEELPLKAAALQQKLSTLKTQTDALYPIVVIQPPFSSREPVEPSKLKILALSIIAGGILAILSAFMADFLIRSKAEIQPFQGSTIIFFFVR
jgi:hypothetical protein